MYRLDYVSNGELHFYLWYSLQAGKQLNIHQPFNPLPIKLIN